MQTEISVEIDRAIADVFDYTNNNVAECSKTVVSEEIVDKKPEDVGTTFKIFTEENGRRMEFDGVTTRYESPTASAAYLTGPKFDIDTEYLFEALSESRTRVTQRATVKGKGFFKVMLSCLGWLMNKSSCKAGESELANLKRLLETAAD